MPRLHNSLICVRIVFGYIESFFTKFHTLTSHMGAHIFSRQEVRSMSHVARIPLIA
jgi:hypothetical protein